MQSYYVSLFRISIHEKQEKGKGKWGSELYMEQGQLCKHIECVKGKSIPHNCHFFTLTQFLENKIYTKKTRKLRQNTQ